MGNIKVLWMNNGDESLMHYVEDAPLYGIDVATCPSVAACIERVEAIESKWDVLMIHEGYKTETKTDKSEKREIYKLNANSLTLKFWQSIKSKYISCFVVTDNEKFHPTTKFSLKQYVDGFVMLKRKEELFEAIRKAPEANIQRKYSVVCEFCSSPHLVPLLQVLEGNKHVILATDIPNKCRKLLEWIQKNSMFFGKKIPISIKDNLNWPVNKKTKKTCETYDELSLNDFSRAVDKTNYVPEYVKRSFHHCCEITQDGSHLNEIDDLLSKGLVPYVNNSLIYNLLNILHWCATYKR